MKCLADNDEINPINQSINAIFTLHSATEHTQILLMPVQMYERLIKCSSGPQLFRLCGPAMVVTARVEGRGWFHACSRCLSKWSFARSRLLTACVDQFLTGHGLVLGCRLAVGDPWNSIWGYGGSIKNMTWTLYKYCTNTMQSSFMFSGTCNSQYIKAVIL